MILKKLIILIVLILNFTIANSQIIHSERFAVILDSTKNIKGIIVPDFKFQNLKEDLIEFENTANITFKIKKSAITVANKIELSKYGEDVLLSGGFLYCEYRKILDNNIVIKQYYQIHWSEVRGLKFKYAGGANLRYRIYVSNNIGFYVGTGPFYEYEKWNYSGVHDDLIPANAEDVSKEKLKIGSYISFKWKTDNKLDFDISLYHQSEFNNILISPRLASSSSIKYNFTKHLGLILQYQNIYDNKPIVPIDKLYNQFLISLEVSF